MGTSAYIEHSWLYDHVRQENLGVGVLGGRPYILIAHLDWLHPICVIKVKSATALR